MGSCLRSEAFDSGLGAALELRRPAPHARGTQGARANLTSFCLQQRTTPAVVNAFARGYASETKAQPTEVSSILEQRIRGVQEETSLAETGRVLTVGYAVEPGDTKWISTYVLTDAQ